MIKAPKGTQDIFAKTAFEWQTIEAKIRDLCTDFSIEEIRTPTFEFSELFKRGVGETTDIVQKEMFSFTDRGGRDYSLRPEGTAGVARSFIENGMQSTPQPTKFYYLSKAFRAERPQKGRMIEFSQFGVEIIGSANPACDAEVISVAAELLARLGIVNTELKINSLGDNESREIYNSVLNAFIASNLGGLCPTCNERASTNPLRVLDCKNVTCQDVLKDAPSILSSLNDESKLHFEQVQSLLTEMGILFTIDERIVRGLDYYTKTVFEFVSTDLGAQSTVCGGGRYDNLIEQVGGKPTSACGFGLGLERLMIILEEQNKLPVYKPYADLFIGSIGEAGFKKSQAIAYNLRKHRMIAESDTLGRSVKAQLKYADKIGAKYSIVVGDDEIRNNVVQIKDMLLGKSEDILLDKLYEFLQENNQGILNKW